VRRLALAIILIAFMFGLGRFFHETFGDDLPPSICLGFILLASSAFAHVLSRRTRLPKITGYMILGLLAGPYVLNLIPKASVDSLKLIDDLAIALIAMSAGGEMRFGVLRLNFTGYVKTLTVIFLVVVTGSFVFCLAGKALLPAALREGWGPLLAAAALLAVSAAAKSPATTIAILKETDARGTLSEWTLNVLILLDAVVVVAFSFILALAEGLIGGEGGFRLGELLFLLKHIFGAVALGLIMGAFATLFLRRIEANHLLFVLLTAIIAVQLSRLFHLDLLILGVSIGFSVENFSRQGDRLIKAIEHGSAPVYVVFFTLVGADVRVDFLRQYWLISLASALAIGALTWLGVRAGARVARQPQPIQRYGWLGFISQAGVNLSFAVIIGERFTEIGAPEIGLAIKTLIIARVAINQIVGPILFRIGLSLAGEIPEERPRET
jgi:Kef-type K+ transport system membrane component KefB